MQSNKASKKTRKATDTAAVPETKAEAPANPRVSRSSQSKMQETNDIASLSHHHKIVSPAPEGIVEPTRAQPEARESENRAKAAAAGASHASEVNPADVANLAYAYFEARGYRHGHADEDWLRAERELRSAPLA
ncbi:MAG: DUF2934 domain-containing protein [Bryobacteraceae bacterium]